MQLTVLRQRQRKTSFQTLNFYCSYKYFMITRIFSTCNVWKNYPGTASKYRNRTKVTIMHSRSSAQNVSESMVISRCRFAKDGEEIWRVLHTCCIRVQHVYKTLVLHTCIVQVYNTCAPVDLLVITEHCFKHVAYEHGKQASTYYCCINK